MQNYLDSNFNIVQMNKKIQELMQRLDDLTQTGKAPSNSTELEDMEKTYHKLVRELADLHSAIRLQKAVDNTKEQCTQIAKSWNKAFKNKGLRVVNIRFLGGSEIPIVMAYYARNCDQRCQRLKGCYPVLVIFGIYDGCSPELASEISMSSAALCSLEEAQHMLASRGCKLNIKTIRNVMKRFSARARLSQGAGEYACKMKIDDKQRRIVVSTDGGRIRIRKNKRCCKTKKNRKRFYTDWREPKLLIIYIADHRGHSDKRFFPIIDGLLANGDCIFELIKSYLKYMNITREDKLMFIGDGALWIWERTEALKIALGLDNQQVYELLDFYHVMEHINDFAEFKTDWSANERKKWVNQQRKHLKIGKTKAVIDKIKEICASSKNKDLNRERDYFIKNECRMNYAHMASLKFPIGSGAIESTIRRVVNLRLKNPGTFWSEESANQMILLRSYYKAGRWDVIKKMASHNDLKAVA